MFHKMRNRILLLNMAMASTVVIAAFLVIFISTYIRIQQENRDKLARDIIGQMVLSDRAKGNAIYDGSGVDGGYVSGFARRIAPDVGLSFSLLTDSSHNIVDINSMVDLPSGAYWQAAAAVRDAAGGSGAVISLEGRVWQYAISPVNLIVREAMGNGVATTVVEGGFSNIRFLDVTDSYKTIQSLALLLCGLTAVILAVFFFISRFFANRAILPMEEAWRKQSRFIADASHELKTPLSVINANCGVLYAGQGETVESQIKWVNSILRATDRMTGLAGSLLTLARMEDFKAEARRGSFDLGEIVREAVGEMEASALQKGLCIHQRIEPDIVIESDKEHVRQILTILLDNAIKYTQSGGEITVCVSRSKRRAVCAIRNTGQGIPPDEMPRLFDRFYRGDPARSSQISGYGLGLSIAKAIAEQLDAQLLPESEPGAYTQFSLHIKAKG